MFRQAPLPGRGTRAVGPTLVALLLASPLSAQSLFGRIPPFPSTCYESLDGYTTAVQGIQYDLQTEMYAAEETNLAVSGSIDLMEQQQRLITAMQSNPQRAMEIMQLSQTLPIEENDFFMSSTERERAFDAEASALVEEYRTTLAARTAAIDARIGEFAPGVDLPDNYMDIMDGLYGQWDAEYAAHCEEWFGPEGRFGRFLQERRGYLLEEWLPEARRLDDLKDEHLAFTAGVDPSRTVFIGEHEAATRYIDTILTLLVWRESDRRRNTRGAIGP